METRASYVAVGTFVLVAVMGLAAFVVWLGTSSLNQAQDLYRIFFGGSVTGLQVGSPVRYRGVPVGSVNRIRINPDNLQEIEVLVALEPGTPIVEDNVARLDLQGLTGGMYVQITGGSQGSPPLVSVPDEPPPIIESEPTPLELLFSNVPSLVDQAGRVMNRLETVLSEENSATLAQAIADTRRLTQALADENAGLPAILARIEEMSVSLNGLVAEARVDVARLSDRVDGTLGTMNDELADIGGEVEGMTADIRQLVSTYTTVGLQVQSLLAQSRPGVEEFAQTGLYEFTLMTSELRGLAQTLSRLAGRFERDPAQFLLGETSSGVRIE